MRFAAAEWRGEGNSGANSFSEDRLVLGCLLLRFPAHCGLTSLFLRAMLRCLVAWPRVSSWIAFRKNLSVAALADYAANAELLSLCYDCGDLFTVWSKIGTLGRTLEISRAARRPF